MFHSIKTKLVATFLIALLILSVLFVGVYYQYKHDEEHKLTDMMGYAAAQTCAYVMGEAASESSSFSPGTETYESYRNTLRELCREMEMEYLYAYRCDVENNKITYLISVAGDDEADSKVAQDRPYGTVVDMTFTDVQLRALSGDKVYEAVETDNEFGDMLDWYCRVDGWDGDVLAGASYSVTAQRERILLQAAHSTIPLTLAMLVLLVVQLAILRKNVFNPLDEISSRMRSFSAERASEFKPLGISTNDEIGEISEAFEGMASDIGNYVAHIEQMTEERVQADVELGIARRIQLGIVPERKALVKGDCDISAFARPARAVGGDFYDCIELEDGSVAAIIGDVSGKGVAAALFMTMVTTMIDEELIAGMGPAELLNHINEKLCQSNPEGMFATVFIAIFEPMTGCVRFANAGHVAPLVVGEHVRELEMDPGLLLGLFEGADIQEHQLQLDQGEGLLLYTDGATEAVNSDWVFLGGQRLAESLEASLPYMTAQALVDDAVRIVDEFVGEREQFDDLTLVACMRHAGKLQEVPVSIASFARVRKAIMAGSGADGEKRRLCLACEEAFVNIVSHSGADHVWFSVDDGAEGMRVTLVDDGVPFDMTAVPVPEKDFEDLDGGGMGIGLVRETAKILKYERDGNRNVLTIG